MKTKLMITVLLFGAVTMAQNASKKPGTYPQLLEMSSQSKVSNSTELQFIGTKPTHESFLAKMKFNSLGKLAKGSEGVGGGDPCEDRIEIIRDDLKSWIQKGGAKPLVLPPGVTENQYSVDMLQAINAAKIKCAGPGDKDYPVEVNGTPKVCKFKTKGSRSQITCDFAKFQSMGESDQYVLVHHEYAGIADIERPNLDDSNYDVSNQISAYLVDYVVKKLAVKQAQGPETGLVPVKGKHAAQVANAFSEVLENTEFSDCNFTLRGPGPSDQPFSCDGESYWVAQYDVMSKQDPKKVAYRINTSFSCEPPTYQRGGNFYSVGKQDGVEVIQHFLKWNFVLNNERIDFRSTFYLDPSSNFVSKAVFSPERPLKKNIGTVTQPNYTEVQEVVWSLTCRGQKKK